MREITEKKFRGSPFYDHNFGLDKGRQRVKTITSRKEVS